MDDIKQTIAKNICELRKKNKLTQLELAEKLNYSDKAISRWERGDSLPDIDILCKICDLFNVPFEYLISKEAEHQKQKFASKAQVGNRLTISLLAITVVWLIATFIYVYSGIIADNKAWQIFVWAIPITALVGQICNSFWGKKKYSVIIVSVLNWSLLAAIYIQFLQYNIWLIFLLGVPIEILIVLWSRLKPRK